MQVKFRTFLPFISRVNFKEVDGRYQYTIRYCDIVICICYQPPYTVHLHPNKGSGVASEAVYVLKGEYRSKLVPLNKSAQEVLKFNEQIIEKQNNIEYDVVIKEKEFKILDHRREIANMDTAGPEGAFMLHFNPIDETRRAEYQFIESSLVLKNDRARVFITLEPGIFINNVEVPLLSRVVLHENTEYSITCSDGGKAILVYTYDESA